jgi:hypothetical protein
MFRVLKIALVACKASPRGTFARIRAPTLEEGKQRFVASLQSKGPSVDLDRKDISKI